MFITLGTVYCALGLPRQALCLAAGLAFGTLPGLAYATLTTLGGSLLGYAWARLLARGPIQTWLARKLSTRFTTLHRALNRTPFRTILTLRLLPIGSALVVNLAAGIFAIPILPFLAATVIGSLPQNLVFVMIGGGTHIGHGFQLALAIILAILSIGLGLLIMKRSRLGQEITPDTTLPQTSTKKTG